MLLFSSCCEPAGALCCIVWAGSAAAASSCAATRIGESDMVERYVWRTRLCFERVTMSVYLCVYGRVRVCRRGVHGGGSERAGRSASEARKLAETRSVKKESE